MSIGIFKLKTIPLSQGKVTLVDDEDYEMLTRHRWHVLPTHAGNYYAAASVRKNSKINTIYMHKLILNIPENVQVDHINRDGLDNRRINLRTAIGNQNNMNRGKQIQPATSKFKGVNFDHGRWRARIGINKKRIQLGYFSSETEAARKYDEAAKRLFGSYAKLNLSSE